MSLAVVVPAAAFARQARAMAVMAAVSLVPMVRNAPVMLWEQVAPKVTAEASAADLAMVAAAPTTPVPVVAVAITVAVPLMDQAAVVVLALLAHPEIPTRA